MYISYKDRFALLAESMEREKQDLSVRDRAQAKVCRLLGHTNVHLLNKFLMVVPGFK